MKLRSRILQMMPPHMIENFKNQNVLIEIKQSNYEGEIIDFLQKAYYEKVNGIVINPGAYTHYSYAIFDAIKSVMIPTVEVHLSDIYSREEFRKISVIASACVTQISGKGKMGYIEAVKILMEEVKNNGRKI